MANDLRERELHIRRRAIETTLDLSVPRFSTYDVNVLLRRIDHLEAELLETRIIGETANE